MCACHVSRVPISWQSNYRDLYVGEDGRVITKWTNKMFLRGDFQSFSDFRMRDTISAPRTATLVGACFPKKQGR